MYEVVDSYGTRRIVWTRKSALSWLAACSPQAAVFHRLTGKLVATRNQERVY